MRCAWLVACLLCATAHGADLGRLFTTAEERARLDRPPGGVLKPERRSVKLQGLIARRGGEPLAWVDGRPMARGEAGEGFVLLDVDREGALILRDTAPSQAVADAPPGAEQGAEP